MDWWWERDLYRHITLVSISLVIPFLSKVPEAKLHRCLFDNLKSEPNRIEGSYQRDRVGTSHLCIGKIMGPFLFPLLEKTSVMIFLLDVSVLSFHTNTVCAKTMLFSWVLFHLPHKIWKIPTSHQQYSLCDFFSLSALFGFASKFWMFPSRATTNGYALHNPRRGCHSHRLELNGATRVVQCTTYTPILGGPAIMQRQLASSPEGFQEK